MNFARKQLEKYGWKEGEGLGKNKSGISKALKPKLKFDTGGLGHDLFEDIHNTWWQRVYDEAAKNIVTKKDKNDSVVLETLDEPVDISVKKRKKKREKSDESAYVGFVKTSQLDHNVEKRIIDNEEEPEEKKKKVTSGICDLTDEELFKICGGRTAHKGARHGLKMSAKLARIEQQECKIIEKKEIEVEEISSHKKKKKKKKKKRDNDE